MRTQTQQFQGEITLPSIPGIVTSIRLSPPRDGEGSPFDDHLPAPDPELLAALSSPLSEEEAEAVGAVWREAQIQRSRQCLSELAEEVADCWNRNYRARAEGNTELVELEAALLPRLHTEIRRHLHNIEQMEGIFCTPATARGDE